MAVLKSFHVAIAVAILMSAAAHVGLADAPTDLQVNFISPTNMSLTWIDTSSEEDGFVVQRRPHQSNNVWTTLASLPPDTTSYIDTEPTYGLVSYMYRVGAIVTIEIPDNDWTPLWVTVNDDDPAIIYTGTWGTQNWSPRLFNSHHETEVQGASAEFTFNGTAVQLIGEKHGWAGEADIYIDNQLITRASYVAPYDKFIQVIFSIDDLEPDWHTIRVEKSAGGYIFVEAIRYLPAPPLSAPSSAPLNLTAYSQTPTQVKLAWDDTNDNEYGFKIERKTGAGGVYELLVTAIRDADTHMDAGLEPNTQYSYRISAYNEVGDSPDSNEVTVTTSSGPAIPSPVNIVTHLPENPKYFQYKGLPMFLFWGTHHYGWASTPNDEQVAWSGTYANYITLNLLESRYTDIGGVWNKINDDGRWGVIRNAIQSGYNRDVMFHMYFFEGYTSGAIMVNPNGPAMDEEILPGVTRRQFHHRLFDKTVQYVWDLPNVLTDVGFELGAVHLPQNELEAYLDWFNSELKARGRAAYPNMIHMCGAQWGGMHRIFGPGAVNHPNNWSADFIQGEHNDAGFNWNPYVIWEEVYDLHTPLVRMAITDLNHDGISGPAPTLGDYMQADNRNCANMRMQIFNGIHGAEAYGGKEWPRDLMTDEVRLNVLQIRWYIENVRSWGDEPHAEISDVHLPRVHMTTRPVITNPGGYSNGVRTSGSNYDFACVYTDADNDPPAQAEVWVDVNGDGRFDPNPAHGERFAMESSATNYSSGVLYTVNDVSTSGNRYVFRFADQWWSPPQGTGLYHNNNAGGPHWGGISYDTWTLP